MPFDIERCVHNREVGEPCPKCHMVRAVRAISTALFIVIACGLSIYIFR